MIRRQAARWGRGAFESLERLGGGLGTGLLALAALLWTATVGLPVLPWSLRAVRFVADRERARLTRWGPDVIGPGPVPRGWRAVADPTVRRELRWLPVHATVGLLLGLAGVLLPLLAVRDVTFPAWWWLLPDGEAYPSVVLVAIHDWPGAAVVGLLGFGWAAILVGLGPALARAQAWPGRRLLPPHPDTDLSLRVAELTATRAAALDAHAVELRRIERSLHDGTQNRLVAVTVLLGAARRALARDPAGADAILERAQSAAEQALAELRTVARGILPPVLADRGLGGALAALAAECAVPCRVEVADTGRCAASVEATAYFVVAEALTNVSRHSRARHAAVELSRAGDRLRVRVTDDGCGGADEHGGTGLAGIRRRTEAHDGSLTVSSPSGGPTTLLVELPCGS